MTVSSVNTALIPHFMSTNDINTLFLEATRSSIPAQTHNSSCRQPLAVTLSSVSLVVIVSRSAFAADRHQAVTASAGAGPGY